MGYVSITLVYGISIEEKQWKEEIFPKLKKLVGEELEELEDYEMEEELEAYEMKEWLCDNYNFTWNYGYYHSEMTLGFKLTNDDSDIRTGQDFNFMIEKSDLNSNVNDDLMNLLNLDKKDFDYHVLVENY